MLAWKAEAGESDPSFVISHRLRLEDGPQGYAMCAEKEESCIKVTLRP